MFTNSTRHRTLIAAMTGLLVCGITACSPGGEPDAETPKTTSSPSTTSQSPAPTTDQTSTPTPDPTAPEPGETPEAGGVKVWATETLGREKGMYYGHGWMGTADTHTAEAPVPAGPYGVTLACQGTGSVDVVISEGADAPDDAKPTKETVTCSETTTVAVSLETSGMELEFTAPDGIHLYAYKIFERTT
ncbi:hypothetical protein [Arthrobacter castelli]|uniref:hypothetical protein n=1 Tax=Arthrobacter castelli TaxID=271431 RepID=UPI0004200084|nr:hypothetical protein [Arthrobacter castelli]